MRSPDADAVLSAIAYGSLAARYLHEAGVQMERVVAILDVGSSTGEFDGTGYKIDRAQNLMTVAQKRFDDLRAALDMIAESQLEPEVTVESCPASLR